MARNLHMVMSQPPAGVTEAEFDEWYEAHLPEILAVPGFVSVRRFRLEPVVQDPDAPIPFGFLALYEVEGDPAAAVAALAERSLGTKDSYAELKDGDATGPALPSWWDGVRFASWNCVAIGDRLDAPGG